MRIHVRLAEPFWRTVGQRELSLELKERAQVTDLLALLRQRYPALGREMDEIIPHIFIGEEEASPQTPLTEGARVHLVWPVAGG